MNAVLPRHVTTNLPPDPHLDHLQAELARVDVLIRSKIQQQQKLRASRGFPAVAGGIYGSNVAAYTQAASQSAGSGETDWAALYRATADQAATAIDLCRQAGQLPRLLHLVKVFDLDMLEQDLLLIALAPALDPHYGRLYAHLLDDATVHAPTVGLALELLVGPGVPRLQNLARFDEDARLIASRLVELSAEPGPLLSPVISRWLTVPPAVVAWLLGQYQPDPLLRPYIALQWPEPDESDVVVTAEVWPKLVNAMQGQTISFFYGVDREAQLAAVRRLARGLGTPLLSVDLGTLWQRQGDAAAVLQLARRDARLTGALLHLDGLDGWLVDGLLPGNLAHALFDPPDLLVITGLSRWRTEAVERNRRILWLEFAAPSYRQRQRLWRHYLQNAVEIDPTAITQLAGQFDLTSGQVRDAVAMARDTVLQQSQSLTIADFVNASRTYSGADLADLARHITPRYRWSDLIVPDEVLVGLREVVAMVQERSKVLEEWGVGKKLVTSPAITMLFAGQPGTGKTMAAEVIAAELGLELYTIDLSAMVSKYIGETEKNLERIFNSAEQSNAILFFDEADAIFGKRSSVKDSHDRYANMGVSYLLQRMESHRGVTILATNLRANLDEAFTRRLQFAVDFPYPNEQNRLRIWETLFPPEVPRAPDLDLAYMAQQYKFSGGNIRNILVSAAFQAARQGTPVTMEHLLHGARRELQKLGRLVDDGEMRRRESLPSPPHAAQAKPTRFNRPTHR